MRASSYNYQVKEKDTTIFFNGITEAGFRVSNKNADAFSAIIHNPDCQDEEFRPFIERMHKQGFIVDDETDEKDLIRRKYEYLRKPGDCSIMILPTYQCNVRCWYCVQNHEDIWMSDETIERITRRIEMLVDKPEIERLSISWFGGEPMLAYDKVLELTRRVSSLAAAKGKPFSANITTNGTLLTPKRIEELKEAGVNHYQITIDGDRTTHNGIKVLGNASAYDRTMENIGHIIEHSTCTLRFNYTKDNLKPESIIKDLDDTLPQKGRNNISFLVYKVWQENAAEIPQEEVEKLLDLACIAGIRPRLAAGGMCYADQKYFDCIFTNGKVGKCDNQPPDSAMGEIDADGNQVWDGDVSSHKAILDTDAPECAECRYLPICWGPCTAKRERMIREKGVVGCQFADKEGEIIPFIRNAFLNYEYAMKINRNLQANETK